MRHALALLLTIGAVSACTSPIDRAQTALSRGDTATARRILEHRIEVSSEDTAARVLLASVYDQEGVVFPALINANAVRFMRPERRWQFLTMRLLGQAGLHDVLKSSLQVWDGEALRDSLLAGWDSVLDTLSVAQRDTAGMTSAERYAHFSEIERAKNRFLRGQGYADYLAAVGLMGALESMNRERWALPLFQSDLDQAIDLDSTLQGKVEGVVRDYLRSAHEPDISDYWFLPSRDAAQELVCLDAISNSRERAKLWEMIRDDDAALNALHDAEGVATACGALHVKYLDDSYMWVVEDLIEFLYRHGRTAETMAKCSEVQAEHPSIYKGKSPSVFCTLAERADSTKASGGA